MNLATGDELGQNGLDPSAPSQHGNHLDEGYWESLLHDGEIVSHDSPPPWISLPPSCSSLNPDGHRAPEKQKDWQRAKEYLANGTCCELPVIGYNRGGLLVRFGQLTGFVPSSHLVNFPLYTDLHEREHALMERVGQQLRLRVIEIEPADNRLILSERAARFNEESDQVFERLRSGDVVKGRVSNLCRFGAFVDLGGFEGLIHISQLSWGRVGHPAEVVRPGDEVEVYVLDVNRKERRIQLSLKRLQPDPWQDVAERYAPGDLVRGEVTNVVGFGAFVRLEPGIEGLIHVSELAEGNFLHPRNVVCEGQWIEARVLSVDPEKRRIGLSLRQAGHARPMKPNLAEEGARPVLLTDH